MSSGDREACRLSSLGLASVSNGFYRVTRNRPCRICGKTDWCGYSKDEHTSICMRVSDGSKGPSRNGGSIHVHGNLAGADRARSNKTPPPPLIEIAPVEIRNAVYRELIRASPARRYCSQLIDCPGGLLSRGLLGPETDNYGALPPTDRERTSLARSLNKFVTDRFPEYALRKSHAGVVGMPGFWQDSAGIVRLWKSRDYKEPLLVVPYKDVQGRIQACQLRLQKSDIPESEKKYRWLSSRIEPRGTGSGTPIHFTFKAATLPPGRTVIVTEGALKAETLVSLRPEVHVIATGGVSCSHVELIKATRPYNALIAFDADHKTNPAVCHQLARLIAAREQDIAVRRVSTNTRILSWETHKGIDEAAFAKMPIEMSTILQWYSTLEGKTLAEVQRVWDEANYYPGD